MNPVVVDSIAELAVRPERKDVGKHKPGNNGFGLCPHCGRPVHVVWATDSEGYYLGYFYYRHNPVARLRVIHDNARTHCSKCSKPGPAYEFKPGSGECSDCQT